ncbi:eukaryotic translation initiation factor 1-like [Hylobates moloch]|uniref:eukaryotic translation initiation factor 1-like n=1 Tax=Hylobates moloch TaxID=81572 RepID=UPI0026751A4F|nr:eukaryotic translation initiation factor 1-like [Hylobates moloch]
MEHSNTVAYKETKFNNLVSFIVNTDSAYLHGAIVVNEAVSTEEKESYRKFAIQNLHSFNPFADASKGDDLLPAGTEDYIHIRIQQKNGRKTLTTVQRIADDYDKKKLVKAFKKFTCNGTVIEHPEYGEVIQPQGDQRKNICQFLVELGLAKDDQLKVHGFYVLVAH